MEWGTAMALQLTSSPIKPVTDEQKVAMGYSLVTADVSFYFPHKPQIICPNSIVIQLYDLVPTLPELNDELHRWTTRHGIRLESVKVAHCGGVARISAADGMFRLH